jgi:(S)-citramalyl-CoA lyase
MLDLNAVRSILFCPADRPERFEKVAASGADAIAIDLEDAIGLPHKATARASLFGYLAAQARVPGPAGFRTMVRLNSPMTRAGLDDLHALLNLGVVPDALLLPKVESPYEVALIATQLRLNHTPTALVAFIETARGLDGATDIAGADPLLRGLAFGGADLAADLGALMNPESLLVPRHTVVRAAARHGLASFDVPYIVLDDDSELAGECGAARAIGFTGKLAIHPKHVAAVNQAFTPTDPQIAHAQALVAAFDAAQGSVCEVNGKMVDEPLVRMARRVLARVR